MRHDQGAGRVAEQAALSFGGLLRQLRAEERLTQLPANGSMLVVRYWLAAAGNSSSEACSRVSKAWSVPGMARRISSSFTLSRTLMACLSVLDSEDRAEISIALLSAISAF